MRLSLKIRIVLFFFIFLLFIAFFSLSLLSFHYADDFWKISLIDQKGYIGVAKWMYLNWDGRGISPIYFFRNYLVYSFSPKIVSLFSAIGLIILSSLLLKNIFRIQSSKTEIILYASLVTLFCFGFWMSWRPHLSRSFYWSTGVFYFWSNFSLLIAVSYSRLFNHKAFLFFVFYSVCMLSGVNSSIVLLFLMIYNCLVFKKFIFYDTILLVYGLILFFINVLAPGNFIRGQGLFNFSVEGIFRGFYFVFSEYLFMSIGVFLFSLLVSILIVSYFSFRVYNLKYFYFFIISGLLTVAPFSIFPESASKHTAIFFQSLWFIGFIHFYSFYLTKINFRIKYNYLSFGLSLIFIGCFLVVIQQLYFGNKVSLQVKERYEYLSFYHSKADTVYLKRIILPDNSFCFRIFEISKDSDFPQNRLLSEYFDVGPIVLID